MDDDTSPAEVQVGGTWSVDLWLWQLTWSAQTRAIHEVSRGSTPPLWEAVEFLVLEDRPRLIAAFFGCVNDRSPFCLEAGLTTAKGRLKRVRITGFPVDDGRGKLVAVRGLIEEVMMVVTESTPESGALSSAELQAMIGEWETLAYAIPHELRAPLAAMHGFATALEEHESGALSPRGRHYLQRILAASARMDSLTRALMTLAPRPTGALRNEHVDLSVAAREVVDMLAGAEPSRQVQWDIQPGLAARGDPVLLAQVLGNLLGNAWKFTRGRTQARIALGARHLDGRTVYSVLDNGVGFDMQSAGKLFSAFHRMHPEFDGTGVGLAVVRRVVERHGGRVWAESSPGAGATFFFTLCLSSCQQTVQP